MHLCPVLAVVRPNGRGACHKRVCCERIQFDCIDEFFGLSPDKQSLRNGPGLQSFTAPRCRQPGPTPSPERRAHLGR